jgi:pimeloyl-ACP methyl ester carboxylesterase
MTEHLAMDYHEAGSGTTILFVSGSCSTGAAWKPVIAALGDGYRSITTSLPGYGVSVERRPPGDTGIGHHLDALASVIDRAGSDVHIVGHSFGAHLSLALCLRGERRIRSLFLAEPPSPSILQASGEHAAYAQFREMSAAFVADFARGYASAAERVIDFYGGPGTFASWPERLRQFVVLTTPTLVLDWESAYANEIAPNMLARIDVPLTALIGRRSHPAVRLVNQILCRHVRGARLLDLEDAAHFMIATHPEKVAAMIRDHLRAVEGQRAGTLG